MERAFWLIPAVFLIACEQAEGERCQVDEDCAGKLICCKPAGSSSVSSGICKYEHECTSTEEDAQTDTGEDPAGDRAEPGEDVPLEEEVREEATDPPAEDFTADDTSGDALEEAAGDGEE